MSDTLMPFDMAAILDSDEAINEYVAQVWAEGDTNELIRAVGNVAKARGMAQIAKDSGLAGPACTRRLLPAPSHDLRR